MRVRNKKIKYNFKKNKHKVNINLQILHYLNLNIHKTLQKKIYQIFYIRKSK